MTKTDPKTDIVEIIKTQSETFTWRRSSLNETTISDGDFYSSKEVCILAAKRFNKDVAPENFRDTVSI